MKQYRYLYEFIMKVYLEVDEEISGDIARFSEPLINESHRNFYKKIDEGKFREGVDITLLFKTLQWCADGFMRSAMSSDKSIDEIDL